MGRKKSVQKMMEKMNTPKKDTRSWWEVGCLINGKWEKFLVHAEEWTVGREGYMHFYNFNKEEGYEISVSFFRNWEYVIQIKESEEEPENFEQMLDRLKQTSTELPVNFGNIV